MKIVVLDRATMGFDIQINKLADFGELTVHDRCSPSDTKNYISDADAIILNKVKLTREILETAENLKLVCVFATGYDNIDINAAKEKGIAVCNVPGYSTDSVTLFTFATALALITHLREYNDFVTKGDYSKSRSANKIEPVYHELNGKTWGIIGLGNIGKNVAKVAKAFGSNVICYTRTQRENYNCVDIDTLCKESDIISIHCPLTEKTKHLINKEKISLMKRNVIIVNEARGAVVCEDDIRDALKKEKIGGFGCDVYSEEPFTEEHPYFEIKHLDNVILTPHTAWASFEARSRCLDIICNNIKAFLCGDKSNRVD